MKQNTICQVCGKDDFESRRIEYIYRHDENYLIVRNVPCEVCLHQIPKIRPLHSSDNWGEFCVSREIL
jgi:YgiT-type zinc finger domain-containing protein